MADDHGGGSSIPDVVPFLIGLFLVLGALWWVRGGYTQTQEGWLLRPPPPLDTGEVYDPQASTTKNNSY
jgi:hypothetical protein